jgi:hypothetical protein
MVDIPADADRERAKVAKAWRTLAVLLLLGILSVVVMSDQPNERRECGPMVIGTSAVGSCDWLTRSKPPIGAAIYSRNGAGLPTLGRRFVQADVSS